MRTRARASYLTRVHASVHKCKCKAQGRRGYIGMPRGRCLPALRQAKNKHLRTYTQPRTYARPLRGTTSISTTHINAHAHARAHTYPSTHAPTHTHTNARALAHSQTCVCTHTNAHTHTHSHRCTHSCAPLPGPAPHHCAPRPSPR